MTPGTTNAKFSAGGLLDAECFVQARQIGAGTQDPDVRQTNTEQSVHALYRRGHITRKEIEQVEVGYRLLRAVTNSLRIAALARSSP